MAERPSVKDILAAARNAGPAKPAAEEPAAAEEQVAASTERPAAVPQAAPSLGRPLTLKEKLAAARGGAQAAQPPVMVSAEASAEAASEAGSAPSVPPPAPSIGRPLTLKEKLAAAKAAGGTAPSAAAKAAPGAKAAAPAAKTAPTAARELPPLDQMNDPKDLAEAARRAAAVKNTPAKKAEPADKGHAAKKAEPKSVPPKPSKDAVLADRRPRRDFIAEFPWIAAGWGMFTAAMGAMTLMTLRFLFPNVITEPPQTVKIGPPTQFEPEEVSERWKTDWGFWIVRSKAYSGEDIIYALQSVCTHLGCPPNWLNGEQKFKCPCHGSGFYISGINFEGPAPRPLERFKIAVGDDGQLVVDKSQTFKEEQQQWQDPDSFVAAV